jgi:hypothetical protein
MVTPRRGESVKIVPSKQMTKMIETLLASASEHDGASLLRELARAGAQRLIQQALEQEQADYRGRGRYERQGEEEARRLYRNGYERGRLLRGSFEKRQQSPHHSDVSFAGTDRLRGEDERQPMDEELRVGPLMANLLARGKVCPVCGSVGKGKSGGRKTRKPPATHPRVVEWLALSSRGRTRTYDPLINSQML